MWLFTRYGFFSIACARTRDGSLDKDTVMVRARRRDHLANLQRRFPALAEAEVFTLPERDYRYRLIVPKAIWAAVVGELAQEQEWSNFKNEAARFTGREGSSYTHALHEVWQVMFALQRP